MRALLVIAWIGACTPSRTAPKPTLRVAVSGPLEPVSPSTAARGWSILAQRWVYEPLAVIGAQGDIVPVLAQRVEIAGKRDLRVWLRPEARFSDGAPVTFEDVAASLAAGGIDARGDGEAIVVASREPFVPTELKLMFAYIFRRSGNELLGTGRFVAREHDSKHVRLSRVRSEPGRIDQVVIDTYPTPKDAFAHTLRGDADWLPEVDQRWVEFFEGVPRLRIVNAPSRNAAIVAFNLTRLSRSDRVALSRVLASGDLRNSVFGDSCTPFRERPGNEPLPPGRPLDVLAVPVFERFAIAIRRALGPRGGEVRMADLQVYFTALKGGEFDLVAARPLISPPIMSVLSWRTGSPFNVLGYSNPRVDAALDARDWEAAQRELDEDPPAAFVCMYRAVMVIDSRFTNASASFETMPDWEVAQ